MLQIYRDGFTFIAEIGKTITEGPYGEDSSFEIIGNSKDSSLVITLINLDEHLVKQNEKIKPPMLKKTYRLYGQDKYTEQSQK